MGELDRPHKQEKSFIDELVYAIVQLIPIGYTVTYKAIADLLGVHPRRVALALKRNNKPIVIPCHRVVSAKGLGGYTPAGIDFKKRLLELEGAITASGRPTRIINSMEQLVKLIFKHKGQKAIIVDDC